MAATAPAAVPALLSSPVWDRVPPAVQRLLDVYRVTSTGPGALPATHVWVEESHRGAYHIPLGEECAVWDALAEYLTAAPWGVEGTVYSLAEVYEAHGVAPMVLDVDLASADKSALDDVVRESLMQDLCQRVLEAVVALYEAHHVELRRDPLTGHVVDDAVVVHVFERPGGPRSRDKDKSSSATAAGPVELRHGYHMMLPGVVLPLDMRRHLRNAVVAMMGRDHPVLPGLVDGPTGAKTWEKVVDAQPYVGSWMMYGASTDRRPGYRWVQTRGLQGPLVGHPAATWTARQWLEELSIRTRQQQCRLPMPSVASAATACRGAGAAPRSAGAAGAGGPPGALGLQDMDLDMEDARSTASRGSRAADRAAANEVQQAQQAQFISEERRELHAEMLKVIADMVDVIDERFSVPRREWLHIGMALHNLSPEPPLLQLWIDFSKKCPEKYKPGECSREWARWTRKGSSSNFSIATLFKYVKESNPDRYCELRRQFVQASMEHDLLSPSDTDMARALYKRMVDKYRCTEATGRIWYEFDEHKWIKCDYGLTLKRYISGGFHDEYALIIDKWSRRLLTMEEGNPRKPQLRELIKTLRKTQKRLVSRTSKQTIFNESIELFYSSTFTGLLDGYPNLVGFANGVYDLDAQIFRDGEPEDMINMTCGYDYVPEYMEYVEYPERDPKGYMPRIYRFLQQIFPEPRLYEYVLTFLASALYGRNMDQKFHLFTGIGANGKSALMSLIKFVFGDYFCTQNPTLLTSERQGSSAPSPDILDLRGRRLVVMSEPEAGKRINSGFMKSLTGGTDLLVGRQLHSPEIVKFPSTFKLAMLCNDLPTMDSVDNGTWRRVCAVPCESIFKDVQRDGPCTRPYHFVMDGTLDKEFPEWKERVMCLLIMWYHTQYKVHGLRPPAKILEKTSRYLTRCNAVKHFFEEKLREVDQDVPDNEQRTVTDLFGEFRMWYEGNHGTRCTMNKPDFEERLDRALSDPYAKRGQKYLRLTLAPLQGSPA